MWYFAWILGTAFACSFAVLNAVWFELRTHSPSDVDSNKGSTRRYERE